MHQALCFAILSSHECEFKKLNVHRQADTLCLYNTATAILSNHLVASSTRWDLWSRYQGGYGWAKKSDATRCSVYVPVWESEYIYRIYASLFDFAVIRFDEDLRRVTCLPGWLGAAVVLTCKLSTDWNRTYLKTIGWPSLIVLSETSRTCATSGSSASCTSSKPIAVRLTSSFMALGPLCGSALCRIILLIRTRRLNWCMALSVIVGLTERGRENRREC